MAKLQKIGLDYFPLDVDIDQDDKIQLIEAQFGLTGFGIVIKLFMKIYKEGYFYKWTEKEQLLFLKRINVNINDLNNVVNECIKWGLFDEKLYKNYKILTSKGIQKRYLEATSRRKNVEIIKQYCLVDISGYSNVVIVDIKDIYDDVNVNIYLENDDIYSQSKVKESKVKENKEKYAEYVSLTKEEYQKLVEKYGEENTKRFIEKLNAYKGSTGKRYKSDYLAILNWVVEKILGSNPPPAKNNLQPYFGEAKKCFLIEHKGYCENPTYTSTGKILKICEICKDNRARWRGG